jgi:hypothetical protein
MAMLAREAEQRYLCRWVHEEMIFQGRAGTVVDVTIKERFG